MAMRTRPRGPRAERLQVGVSLGESLEPNDAARLASREDFLVHLQRAAGILFQARANLA